MDFEEISENINDIDEGIHDNTIHNIADSTFFSSAEDRKKHPGRYLESTQRMGHIAPQKHIRAPQNYDENFEIEEDQSIPDVFHSQTKHNRMTESFDEMIVR